MTVQHIGKYSNRQVFWTDYHNDFNQLPDKDWICLAIANSRQDEKKFDKFTRISISKNILEFKAHGEFGEVLHDLFDDTMIAMETIEDLSEIDVMTTWHHNQTLADVFWQCFFATCLPDTADHDNLKIICTDLEGTNRIEELKDYIKEFELGWIPSENVKHEVWRDSKGLAGLCLADERGENCRKLLEPGSELIHSFYAESHYEAMTIYYQFMNWGTYRTEFEIDKQPYKKKTRE